MSYKIFLKKSAQKSLNKLPIEITKLIESTIDSLSDNPHPTNSKKLSGFMNVYRVRVSNYRIIYEVKDTKLEILVIKIAHRKDVYN
ncbi:type II toxin-antitoxin system RelE/ParE family toxin [Candidatus Dojkabacteria bacterium]|uniref:Type II toxin-antitoxin system RelE/ParE family toxin n=1 Tax=Candidatus Dojkabacteria bacterium TaxID=2099670 RepID=A0A955LBE7_9BACT|nr:type II toxin-antitoxin system RelE/ParE family toxin [Candidatus Dojkabacteria bacterium]